jgi:thiol-disulfide isomerase/thioredoxin
MKLRWVFAGVGLLSMLAGASLWLGSRAPSPPVAAPLSMSVAPVAMYAASFADANGRAQGLGQFQDKLLVLNFWATWCGPCRDEMPAFARVQARWADRGVQFVGLSGEEPAPVARFGRELGINYPLWTGGEAVAELSRRLGNRLGVLPHTVILGPGGAVLDMRVGPYSEAELETRLTAFSAKTR